MLLSCCSNISVPSCKKPLTCTFVKGMKGNPKGNQGHKALFPKYNSIFRGFVFSILQRCLQPELNLFPCQNAGLCQKPSTSIVSLGFGP